MSTMQVAAVGRHATGPRVGVQPVTDTIIAAALARLNELEDAAKEHERLAKMVKEHFKPSGSSLHLAGRMLVTVKVGTTTVYDVPDLIKRQYARTSERVTVTWAELVEACEEPAAADLGVAAG
jgi:hypothetical protein